jgi:hypothetical protein
MLRSNAARRQSVGTTKKIEIQAGWRPAPSAAARGLGSAVALQLWVPTSLTRVVSVSVRRGDHGR